MHYYKQYYLVCYDHNLRIWFYVKFGIIKYGYFRKSRHNVVQNVITEAFRRQGLFNI